MMLLKTLRSRSSANSNIKPPQSAKDWILEAETAEEGGDWTRAIVCYRRALEAAPFCRKTRDAFEAALEQQILTRKPKRGMAASSPVEKEVQAPKKRRRSHFAAFSDDSDDQVEQLDESALPAWLDAPRAAARRAVDDIAMSPRRIGKPVMATVVALAIFITTGGLLMAASTGSLISGLFGSNSLPKVTTPAIPDGLKDILEEANRLLTTGNPSGAVSLLVDATDQYPEQHNITRPALAQAWRSLGRSEELQSNFARAADAFRSAADLEPKEALNWIDLGRSLREQGRQVSGQNSVARARTLFTEAESAYQQALRFEPNDPLALFGLAQVYDALNDRNRAITNYERVIRVAPDSLQGRLATSSLAELRKSR